MSVTKTDFKRELGHLYLPGPTPSLVDVPDLGFVMIDGHGNPNTGGSYREAIEALYSVAYTVKFTVKRMAGGVDFAVMPLESLWWSSEDPQLPRAGKELWSWTAMIMQPEPVDAEIVQEACRELAVKKRLPALELLRYERFAEGPAAQLMYRGPYKDEGPTIEALHAFIAEQGLVPSGRHHEIYLGDPRRSAPEKLRTVIRQPVATHRAFDP